MGYFFWRNWLINEVADYITINKGLQTYKLLQICTTFLSSQVQTNEDMRGKKTAVNGEFSINKLKQHVIHFTDAAQWINNKMEVLKCF